MTDGEGIAGISLDFWETLVSLNDPSDLMKKRAMILATATGASPAECEEELYARDRATSVEDWIRDFLLLRHSSLQPKAVATSLSDLLLDHPLILASRCEEVLVALAAIAPLAIISNAKWSNGATLRSLLGRLHLEPLFSAFAFSDEMGIAKPDPRIFEAAWKSLGVATGTTIHVGDRVPEDVGGARAANARVVLARHLWRRRESNEAQSDAILFEFALLPSLLRYMATSAVHHDAVRVRRARMPIVVGRLATQTETGPVYDNRIVQIGSGWNGDLELLSCAACLLVNAEYISDSIVGFCTANNMSWFIIEGENALANGENVLVDGHRGQLVRLINF